MEENYNDLLNLTVDDFKSEDKKQIERYRPDAKAGSDNVYTSVVRFIPWYKNPKESIKSKWTSWLVDPDTEEGKYVDCPSSIGQKSILQDMFWKLKKSDSIAEQKLADVFSRRQQFSSLVQVVEDKHHPELVGKILVYQYGIKIHKKLMSEMKPQYGQPHIPFDLFSGKSFLFQVTLISNFNNYDECKFLNDISPVRIDGKFVGEKSQENLEKIVNFLKENSPDLDRYGYHEWDQETTDFVMNVIKNTVPKGKLTESILKKNQSQIAKTDEKISKHVEEKITKSIKEEDDIEDDLPDMSTIDSEDSESESDFNIDDENFDADLYEKL